MIQLINLVRNYNDQSITDWLFFLRYAFVLENGLLPKKPLDAERGEG